MKRFTFVFNERSLFCIAMDTNLVIRSLSRQYKKKHFVDSDDAEFFGMIVVN